MYQQSYPPHTYFSSYTENDYDSKSFHCSTAKINKRKSIFKVPVSSLKIQVLHSYTKATVNLWQYQYSETFKNFSVKAWETLGSLIKLSHQNLLRNTNETTVYHDTDWSAETQNNETKEPTESQS